MMSALRREDGCSRRMACRLGQLARSSPLWQEGSNLESLLYGLKTILPKKYKGFMTSWEAVAREQDESSCTEECYRCVAI